MIESLTMWQLVLSLLIIGRVAAGEQVTARRLQPLPLFDVRSMPAAGDNINGPSLIRVPNWISKPLGRYYLYFAHHTGRHIRLAYSNSLTGPWKLHLPGAVKVDDTAFSRPQPDPEPSPKFLYTHVASPEIIIDEKQKRLVMFFHGMWTDGRQWPAGNYNGYNWLREHGYAQFTQTAVSTDGITWKVLPPITRESYIRLVPTSDGFLGMARLGVLLRGATLTAPLEIGPNPFAGTPYQDRVRHVALLRRQQTLHVFFSAIGDAPERILHTTIPMTGDWSTWRATTFTTILQPEHPAECAALPNAPSDRGEIEGPARQMRDPALFTENGKTYLLYTTCGEQGIAIATLHLP